MLSVRCVRRLAVTVLLIIIAVSACVVALFIKKDRNKFIFYGLIGLCASGCMFIWLRYAQRNPRLPQRHDVYKYKSATTSIQNFGHQTCCWPTAPIPPRRGQLLASRKNGSWFRDEQGRRVILRGINVSGGSKLPAYPHDQTATHLLSNTSDGLFQNQNQNHSSSSSSSSGGGISFVGRPFPLEEADFHL